jgi:hypothetical protein
MSLLLEHKLSNIVIVTVANGFWKENRIMSETAIVSAPGNLHNGIRMATTSEGGKLPLAAKHVACGTFVARILTQSGGFFVHIAKGEEHRPSIGTTITSLGAVLLAAAIGILVYALFFGHG